MQSMRFVRVYVSGTATRTRLLRNSNPFLRRKRWVFTTLARLANADQGLSGETLLKYILVHDKMGISNNSSHSYASPLCSH